MKPELQRIRIAKACGFDESHWLELGGGIVFGTSGSLPDYPNDLNAMHEAEVVIIKSGYTAIRTYEDLLQKQIANIILQPQRNAQKPSSEHLTSGKNDNTGNRLLGRQHVSRQVRLRLVVQE